MVLRKLYCTSGKRSDLVVGRKMRPRRTERCNDDVGAATGSAGHRATAAGENWRVPDPLGRVREVVAGAENWWAEGVDSTSAAVLPPLALEEGKSKWWRWWGMVDMGNFHMEIRMRKARKQVLIERLAVGLHA